MDMEAEEHMWKDIYKKLQKQKSVNTVEHDLQIQQSDGAFFERFGALLHEYTEIPPEELKKPTEEESSSTSEDSNVPSAEDLQETTSMISISDTEDEKDKIALVSVAWNIDELYTEVLHEILHNVGCDVDYEIGQTALLAYAQDVFKVSNDKHQELLAKAEKKEAPDILINVEVIEAKDLKPKDSNGLSDPFVTLFLASNTSHRYNTSVKMTTLSPVWEEHFALPVSDNLIEDNLCLEVWDFDPAESVKEKFGKIFDVKGVKGARKLVKEIAIAAATGQHQNELIGIARIPLKTVPASGMTMWYSLDKKNKINRQGVLKVRVAFSSEKNNQVAGQEHRHLLRLVLLHELETSQVAPFWWCGTLSPQGEALITQHVAQSGLSPAEQSLCQWAVYTSIHQTHPMDFQMFCVLLEKLSKPIQTAGEEDLKLFWDGARKLLPSCLALIRKIRKKECGDKAMLKRLQQVFEIVKTLKCLEQEGELFPKSAYQWLTEKQKDSILDITTMVNYAVQKGASDWFDHILLNNKADQDDVGKLQHLIQVVQLVRSDLQKAIEFHDKLFQEALHFQYAKGLYILYQNRIAELAETDVIEICKNLKKLSFDGFTLSNIDSCEPFCEGTKLFEVYLALHRFSTLGKGLCPADYDSFAIRDYHQWFHGAVAQWLEIAVFKALKRIEKAVELDNLQQVDTNLKYSSSAVDTLTIFYTIKTFWHQLNWPDVEGCYTFIGKIIDDICRCCVFYAERMASRVEGMGVREDVYEKRFEVTEEWCLAINNIEYVRQALQPFTEELGMKEVIEKLSDMKSPLEAQRCQDTLNNVISNAIDTVSNEIIELLETVVSKMEPSMKRLLIEGAELFNQDSNSIDRLMMYVDNNLATLHSDLNEENFDRVLYILWTVLSNLLKEIIRSNLEKRRPPSFFANLHKTLNLMLGSFKNPDEFASCDELKRTERLLELHGLETNDLIHQVHLDLHQQFKPMKESPYGELSVRAKFSDNNLELEIINARNLIAMDSNGSCDPFVRIHLLPEHKFNGISNPKTKSHSKNQFPLFEEKFVINLTEERRNLQDGLLLFSVKDKDMLGYNNQYLAEAFLRFDEIDSSRNAIDVLPQILLPLLRPTDLNSDAISALENRQGDKQAKEFLRKFKQRMNSS